jgi:hypothetical protein
MSTPVTFYASPHATYAVRLTLRTRFASANVSRFASKITSRNETEAGWSTCAKRNHNNKTFYLFLRFIGYIEPIGYNQCSSLQKNCLLVICKSINWWLLIILLQQMAEDVGFQTLSRHSSPAKNAKQTRISAFKFKSRHSCTEYLQLRGVLWRTVSYVMRSARRMTWDGHRLSATSSVNNAWLDLVNVRSTLLCDASSLWMKM